MKLASAEKILSLEPIVGSDFIEKATVLGWEVVVKKNEFKVGDLVCYIQIDTVVPPKEEFEFLRERHFRVRTIKLRKQISQGLIVPLPAGNFKEGDDLTELLGIKKFSKDVEVEEKPRMPKKWYKKWVFLFKYKILVRVFPNLKKVNRKSFPTNLVPITDEERIQNIPHVLQQYKGKMFVVSEKLDGSSITIIHEKKRGKSKFRICSRRFELFNTKNEWHNVFIETGFDKHIKSLVNYFDTNNIIVQGEYIGKPQGNKYNLRANQIRLFNIFVNGTRINQRDFYEACEQLEIPCCPLVSVIPLDHTLESILKESEGKSKLHNVEREGLVWRCVDHPTVSFKAISNKFLLANNE